MSNADDRIALELLGLSLKSRAELAAKLIASLDETNEPDAEERWAQEVDRRVTDLDEGRVECITGDSALKEARRRLS